MFFMLFLNSFPSLKQLLSVIWIFLFVNDENEYTRKEIKE